jgi:hypothetical protein
MVGPSPEDVTFLPCAPADVGVQEQLADAIRDALASLPGPWTAAVTAIPAHPQAAMVSLRRPDGFECTVFLHDEGQRTFLRLRDEIVNALQLHVLGIPRPPSALGKPPS